MNKYEVIFINEANEYKLVDYHANDLRDCLAQFNRDYKHEVDLACIHEFHNGYYNKVFKFKISNADLEHLIRETKKKSRNTNKQVQVIPMKPGRSAKKAILPIAAALYGFFSGWGVTSWLKSYYNLKQTTPF